MYIKIDDKNRVIMQIKDKFAEGLKVDNKFTFRTVHDLISVTNDEVLYYNPETDTFRVEKVEYTEEQIAKAKAMSEASTKKAKALAWLAENDWKCNKIIRGEWTADDPRWIEYLEGAAKARQEQDEANAILNQK